MAQLELNIRKQFAAGRSSPGTAPGFALDVTLTCEAGVTVLFGASGAGKTLTLDSLAGFLRPDSGRILLNDQILFDSGSGAFLPPQRRGVGYVFQNYALFPHMTVGQNLAFGISKLPGLERHRRVQEMLDLFGLKHHAQRGPEELSGGEKQRASIARALITEPRLLLLDEPVRGLDHQLRQDFYAVVRDIREKYRIPILLVTHDVTEGFVLADRMAVYQSGRIVQTGPPADVLEHPRNPAIARLLGITNIFSGTIEELDPGADLTTIRTDRFSVTVPYIPGRLRGARVWFCIPSESVTLTASTSERKRDNLVPVVVTQEIAMPNFVRLLLQVATNDSDKPQSQLECEISRATHKKLGIAAKRELLAELPPTAIHVFPEAGDAA